MKICGLLTEEHIILDLKPGSKNSVLEDLVRRLKARDLIKDEKKILAELKNREGLCSTGLENGIAVPHALIDEIEESFIAISVVKEGMDFEAVDQLPTYVLFLLLGNKDDPGSQLKILAHICRMVKETDFVEKVKGAGSPKEICRILQQEDSKVI